MAADYSTGAAIFLFFLLTLLLNPLAHLLTGSRLHSGELATIYIMMIVASAIPSWGFVMNLIPFLGGLFYFATPENDWANIIHPHIKPWLVSQDRAAIWKLFEGAARGEPVPWGLWHKPMLAWGFFILSVYFVTLCMLVILRKQWMEHERLLFDPSHRPSPRSDLLDQPDLVFGLYRLGSQSGHFEIRRGQGLSPAAPALSRHGTGRFWLGGHVADHRLFWRHVELVYHVNLGSAMWPATRKAQPTMPIW